MRTLVISIFPFTVGDSVVLWAPESRPSIVDGRMVSTARQRLFFDDTGNVVVEVEPGPLMVQFNEGEPYSVYVPDGVGNVYLADLL